MKQERTHLNSRNELINRLKRGRSSRDKLVSSHIDKGIAFQIRAIRDKQGTSQAELAEAIGTNQNNISRLESPTYGKATITTLKKLAAAFDVALVVRFVPFSQLINWVSGTPFFDRGLSTQTLGVSSFPEEEKENLLYAETAKQIVTDNNIVLERFLDQFWMTNVANIVRNQIVAGEKLTIVAKDAYEDSSVYEIDGVANE